MSGLPPVVCSICTELFLFSENDATQVIAAAPCGHTFHLNCLNQWLANSATCPQCRTSTKRKPAIRLFFDHPAFSDGDAASQIADGTISRLNVRVTELNDQLEAKSAALEKSRLESTRLSEHLASSKQLCSKAKASLEEEKSKNRILRTRFEELTSKCDRTDEVMRKYESMARKVSALDVLQKVALDECEAELEQLLHPKSGQADPREVTTWLAVTSRELRSAQAKNKSQNDEIKKLRDRVASEKVRCCTLSEDLRQRSDDLTRCESELKSAEDKVKKQQDELAKLRTGKFTPVAASCRDLYESPAGITPEIAKVAIVSKENKVAETDKQDGDCKVIGVEAKKSRMFGGNQFNKFSEPSPVTPNSVTEFRKMATKALRVTSKQSEQPPGSNIVPPPPTRRGYNGLGGHSMAFGFPMSSQKSRPAKPLLSFPSKRKL